MRRLIAFGLAAGAWAIGSGGPPAAVITAAGNAAGAAALLCGGTLMVVAATSGADVEECADAATAGTRSRKGRDGKAYERVVDATGTLKGWAARRWRGQEFRWQRRISVPDTRVGAAYVTTKWVAGHPVVAAVAGVAGAVWKADGGGGYRQPDWYVAGGYGRRSETVLGELKNVNPYVGWVTGILGTLRPDVAKWVDGFAGQALGYMAHCHMLNRRGRRCRIHYGYCDRPHPGHLAVLAGLRAHFALKAAAEGIAVPFEVEVRGNFARGEWDCKDGDERRARSSLKQAARKGLAYDKRED